MEDRQAPSRRTAAQAIVAGRPGFVDADTALAHLRRMVERGLSDKLRRVDNVKIWAPDAKNKGTSGEPTNDE